MLRKATWNHITLRRRTDTDEEVYRPEIVARREGHLVIFSHARRGSKPVMGKATPAPVSLADASSVYVDLVRRKLAEGYSIDGVTVSNSPRMAPTAAADAARKRGGGKPRIGALATAARQRPIARQRFAIRSGRGKPFNFGVR